MTTHRSVSFFAGLAGIAGISAGFLLFTVVPPAVAHAQGAAAAPAPGIDWGFWLGLLAAIGTAVSLFLHWLAPRTKTTLDDRLRDDLDEALAFARNFTGTTKVETPTAKGGGTTVMLVVLLLGGIAVTQTGCSKEKLTTVATNAEHGLVNCTAQAIGTTPGLDLATLVAVANTVAVEKAKCTVNGTLNWSCVESDAIGEGKVLGGCTIVQLLAAELAPGTTARMVSGDPGRAALEDFRAKMAGGAMFHTVGGDI